MQMLGDQYMRCPRCDSPQSGSLVEDFVNHRCRDADGTIHKDRATKYYCEVCEERFFVLPTAEANVFEVVEN